MKISEDLVTALILIGVLFVGVIVGAIVSLIAGLPLQLLLQ